MLHLLLLRIMEQYGEAISVHARGSNLTQELQFGDFTLDHSRFRLQRGSRVLRLEKRPMELLILLAERHGELVSRDEIAERLWGKDVSLDFDHGINTAIRKVRLALRDDPGNPRFIETVVGKGYRFAAPVIHSTGDPEPQEPALALAALVPAPPIPQAAPAAERIGFRLIPMLVGVAVLALLVAAVVLIRGRDTILPQQPAIKSIAVLPLKNLSGDPTEEYLADGMTESLIGRLSGIHDLRVISRTSVMSLKDTKMSVPQIAKTLNVDAVVEGSVIREGDRIRVHAQLIRAATDEHFWSKEYDRQLPDVLAIQSEVAQSIAREVEVTVTGEERVRLVAARAVAPEVYENYLKGQYGPRNNKAELEKSIAYFQEAIRKDPTFAPAYVRLAYAYDDLGSVFIGVPAEETRPKVIIAARKALELDPDLAEAHVLLAYVYKTQWHWLDAEAEYKRAIELNPNDAHAHDGFSEWLLFQGRTDEALAWARRARELDPLGSGDRIGEILFMVHRYDEAIREFRSLLAVHPDSARAYWGLGLALIGKGQPEEAIPILEKTAVMTDRNPGSLDLLATAQARAGHRAEAFRLISELKRRRQTGYVPAGAFVFSHLSLGEYEEAFAWLERAYQEQSNIMQYLKVHPFFDPVRGDPRFADLLRRVDLDKAH